MAPPASTRRSTRTRSAPRTTGSPRPWSGGINGSTAAGRGSSRCVWNDINGITSAAVALPPRKPYRSTRTTSAPAPAAPSAAPSPAGPPPTTSTSHRAATVAVLGGSTTRRPSRGRVSGGIASARGFLRGPVAGSALVALGEQVHRDLVGAARSILEARQPSVETYLEHLAKVPAAVDVRDEAASVHLRERRALHLEVIEEPHHLARVRQCYEGDAAQREHLAGGVLALEHGGTRSV